MTASKYPFPTVCADKQSTDWFHAISRTLKWNERQRQKSFVVVEEPSTQPSRERKSIADGVDGAQESQDGIEEEDENDDDDEEEEEEYDIDTAKEENEADLAAQAVGEKKAVEAVKEHAKAQNAMRNNGALSNSSHSSNGIDSPNRFAGPVPHPRPLSPRHRVREDSSTYQSEASSPRYDEYRLEGETGDRDDIRGPRTAKESSKSKIPTHRDLEPENVRTPRPNEHYPRHPEVHHTGHGHHQIHSAYPSHRHHHHHYLVPAPNRRTRSLSVDRGTSRAFAVWGHDESDSNTSDSDSQY